MERQLAATFVSRLGFAILLACAVTACYEPDIAAQNPGARQEKERREVIIMDFYNDEAASLKKYQQEWVEDSARRENGLESDEEALTTIAGELISRDPARAREYSAYIFESIDSSNEEVKAAAIGALGEVPGEEAVDVLLGVASHPPGNSKMLAAEAVTALAHKRTIAKLHASRASEVERIEAGSVEMCKESQSNPVVERYCESIGR